MPHLCRLVYPGQMWTLVCRLDPECSHSGKQAPQERNLSPALKLLHKHQSAASTPAHMDSPCSTCIERRPSHSLTSSAWTAASIRVTVVT